MKPVNPLTMVLLGIFHSKRLCVDFRVIIINLLQSVKHKVAHKILLVHGSKKKWCQTLIPVIR